MDVTERQKLVDRLRRNFPRHPDVLAICDEVERMREPVKLPPKRDRAAYMRQYRKGARP